LVQGSFYLFVSNIIQFTADVVKVLKTEDKICQ